jgi:hypothetical protein
LYADLNDKGKQEIGFQFIEEMKAAAKVLP